MRYLRHLIWLFLLHALLPFRLLAQNTPVYQDANRNINLFHSNPGYMRLARSEWTASIFLFTGSVVSNTGTLSSKDLLRLNGNFLRQYVLGTSKISTGLSTLRIIGPSLAYGVTSKLNLMVTTSTRQHSNYWNVDGRLISEIGEIVKVPHEYPYFIKHEKMQMIASVFSEIGLSASYLAYETNNNSLNFGLSLNLINNVASTSISVPEITGTIERINSYTSALTNATGQVSTQTSGGLFGNWNLKNLFRAGQVSFSSTVGVVYEHSSAQNEPFIFRLGLSVNDFGRLRFRADSAYSKTYDVDIPANQALYFNNNFKNSTFSQTTKVYDKYPQFFKKTKVQEKDYFVVLPATLQMTADLRLNNHWLVNYHGVLGLTKKNDIHTLRSNSGAAISPRWEGRNLSVAVSMGYFEFGGLNSGISLRAGPVFISSNTLISSSFHRGKQLNISAGVVYPFRHR